MSNQEDDVAEASPEPAPPQPPPQLVEPAGDPAAMADHTARLTAFLAEWNARERDEVNAKVVDAASTQTNFAANRSAESTIIGALVGGYITVSTASLDRAVSRGTYMTTAAGAITTVYTALLGAKLTSATTGSTLKFTSTALIPAVFLGMAIVFSVACVAFLKQTESPPKMLSVGDSLYEDEDDNGNMATSLDQRLRRFCDWTYGGVRDRSGYLHLSVYSLGIGVALLPIPFIKLAPGDGWNIFAACAGALSAAAVALHNKVGLTRKRAEKLFGERRGATSDQEPT